MSTAVPDAADEKKEASDVEGELSWSGARPRGKLIYGAFTPSTRRDAVRGLPVE